MSSIKSFEKKFLNVSRGISVIVNVGPTVPLNGWMLTVCKRSDQVDVCDDDGVCVGFGSGVLVCDGCCCWMDGDGLCGGVVVATWCCWMGIDDCKWWLQVFVGVWGDCKDWPDRLTDRGEFIGIGEFIGLEN